MTQQKVAQVLINMLHQAGIDHVFGIPGLHTLELWDALYDAKGITTVVTRHEQAAAMAADGYSRVAGKPAAVLAITGPGATNTLTGVATAFADSSPMLVITGEVASDYVGRNCETTHELPDQSLLFQAVTGFHATIRKPEFAAETMNNALNALMNERPRPVQISVPTDIQASMVAPMEYQAARSASASLSNETLDAMLTLIRNAKRPLIYCGGGAQASAGVMTKLAERMGAAVLTTPAGRGVIADDHPLALGCAWTKATRTPEVSAYFEACDLMIAVGASFGGNPTGMWSLPVPENLIHIDVSASILGKYYPAQVAVQARAEEVLPVLLTQLESLPEKTAYQAETQHVYDAIQAKCPPVTRAVLNAIRRAIGRDGVLVNDVTVIAYSAGTYYPVFTPGSYLSPAKFGTLGFGLPAAIGAKLAAKDRPVVAVCGDGGMMLNLHELATAAQEKLSLPIVVHNNHGYNAIRHSQDKYFNNRQIGVDLHTPDFSVLASAFNLPYVLATNPEQLQQQIEQALTTPVPTIIEWTNDLEFPW